MKQRYNDALCNRTRARIARAQSIRDNLRQKHGHRHPGIKRADALVSVHLSHLAEQVMRKNMRA